METRMRRLALISPILSIVLAAPVAAQTPPAPQAPAPQAPAADSSRSLIEVEPNQFLIGGRVTTVDGDPARFQRYQDYRDGLLFSGGRFLREDPKFTFNAMADNLGYRDQRYGAAYNRTGKFTVSGMWTQIPQFYSVDTKTAYTSGG